MTVPNVEEYRKVAATITYQLSGGIAQNLYAKARESLVCGKCEESNLEKAPGRLEGSRSRHGEGASGW